MDKHKARFEKIARQKFFCYFDLKKGCTIIGVLLAIAMAVCIIVGVILSVGLTYCEGCAYNSWMYAFAHSISACIYCCLIFVIDIWFIWGVKKEKKSVVMSWVVISTVVLAQSSCLLLAVAIQSHERGSGVLSFVFNIVCTVFVIILQAYFVLVGYGYWLELRDKGAAPEVPEIN